MASGMSSSGGVIGPSEGAAVVGGVGRLAGRPSPAVVVVVGRRVDGDGRRSVAAGSTVVVVVGSWAGRAAANSPSVSPAERRGRALGGGRRRCRPAPASSVVVVAAGSTGDGASSPGHRGGRAASAASSCSCGDVRLAGEHRPEPELGGAADHLEGPLGVLDAGQVDDDGAALADDLGLGDAEGVDPGADDLDGVVELLVGHLVGRPGRRPRRRPAGRGRGPGVHPSTSVTASIDDARRRR